MPERMSPAEIRESTLRVVFADCETVRKAELRRARSIRMANRFGISARALADLTGLPFARIKRIIDATEGQATREDLRLQ